MNQTLNEQLQIKETNWPQLIVTLVILSLSIIKILWNNYQNKQTKKSLIGDIITIFLAKMESKKDQNEFQSILGEVSPRLQHMTKRTKTLIEQKNNSNQEIIKNQNENQQQ